MLARALCLSLLLEVVLYVAIATQLFDASPAAAAVAAVVGILALRALLVATSYAFSLAWHSPAPRLGMVQGLRMVLAEYAAFVLSFVLIFPVERWWMGADRLPAATAEAGRRRDPVLLVHGYGCSRAAWWWLRRRLEAAGWSVATINLEPVCASIEHYVDPLARRIDEVLAQTGADRLLLVGHSMGGLVARRYLQRFGNARVAKLVTLGTPHHGSQLARIGAGENARQMRPHGDWLRALANPAPLLDTVVIYSPHDNFVMPQANLELPGASHRAIDGLGHLAMLYSPRVGRALLAALAADGGAAGSRR